MTQRTLVAALIISTAMFGTNVWPNSIRRLATVEDKGIVVSTVLNQVSQLNRLALKLQKKLADKDIGHSARNKIKSITLSSRKLENLTLIARLLRSVLSSQSIESRRFDQVYETAFWDAVDAIAEVPGSKAASILESLAMGMQGGERISINECRARQSALSKRTTPKKGV